MRRAPGGFVIVMAFSLAACPSGDEAGDEPSQAESNGGCDADEQPCGFLCCTNGASCVDGECRFPNDTAELLVYVCPSSTGCTPPAYFVADDQCSPAENVQPGTCVGTGLTVTSGRSYAFSLCQSCGGDCNSPSNIPTPPNGFPSTGYAPGYTLACPGDECDPPPDCGGVGTVPPRGGGTPDTSSGGSGGSVGGGTAGSSEPTVCSESAFPTQFDFCIEVAGCQACTVEVCSAIYEDGSCCAGYRTTDTLSFWPCTDSMCSTTSDLCAASAEEALRHCGCTGTSP